MGAAGQRNEGRTGPRLFEEQKVVVQTTGFIPARVPGPRSLRPDTKYPGFMPLGESCLIGKSNCLPDRAKFELWPFFGFQFQLSFHFGLLVDLRVRRQVLICVDLEPRFQCWP